MWPFGAERSALDHGLDAFNARRWRNARRYLEEAANAPLPRAIGDYHLGLLYWRGLGGAQVRTDAVRCFRRAADAGHAAAQTALAIALSRGAGAPRDPDQAQALFRLAAGAGDVDAMTQLATYSDPPDARRLLERAADQGHAPAMRHLCDLLIESEPIEALAWLYTCVGLTGEQKTAKHAVKLARELTADEIAQAQKMGRERVKEIKQERKRR